MIIVDSSGWLEYFADSVNADNFADAIQDVQNLVVPTITLYEVFKKILIEKDETAALMIVGHMKQGLVVDLNDELSISAAMLGKKHKLALADSIILATALKNNALVLTQDADFKDIESVQYFEKK